MLNGLSQTRCLELIHEYLAQTERACILLRDALHIEGNILAAWGQRRVPQEGVLDADTGSTFSFHGIGCRVTFGSVVVDFDFGPEGRSDGFDAWRLHLFAQSLGKRFHEFSDCDYVQTQMDSLLNDGVIVKPAAVLGGHLYYFCEDQSSLTSIPEQKVSRLLRAVLCDLSVGADIPDSKPFRELLVSLEFFIPRVLGELHREWSREESLDGVAPVLSRKIGDVEAEIFGVCILISDQTVTPLHVRLQLATSSDEISWLECRVGEQGPNGMVRKPYDAMSSVTKRVYGLEGRHDLIEWVYKVTFGDRR